MNTPPPFPPERMSELNQDCRVLVSAAFSDPLVYSFSPAAGTRLTARSQAAMDMLLILNLVTQVTVPFGSGVGWISKFIFPKVSDAEMAAASPWKLTEFTS